MDVTKQFILVPLIANDGTYNYIDPADTLDAAYVTALLNNVDDSKRWYPTGPLKNVTTERADPITESFEDGSKVFIRQGVRNFSAMILKGGPELLSQLNSNRCSSFGLYIVDVNGSITGKTANGDGYLYPVEVQSASFNGKLVFTTDTTIQKIMLAFEWGVAEKDEDLKTIMASSFSGVNLASVSGLYNIYATVVSTSTTAMVVKLFAKFGDLITNYPVEGLVTADFVSSDSGATSKIYNVTDDSDVTVTVAESATIPGQYTLTYTAQTTSDVLQPAIKKNGLDGVTIIGTTGTVA
jgi:hypothetical protein